MTITIAIAIPGEKVVRRLAAIAIVICHRNAESRKLFTEVDAPRLCRTKSKATSFEVAAMHMQVNITSFAAFPILVMKQLHIDSKKS